MHRGRTIAAAVLAAVGLTACTGGPATRTNSSSAVPSTPVGSRPAYSASSPAGNSRSGRPSRAAPPDRITTGPTLAGCPLFPPTNPWRRDISGDPVSRYSTAWVASVGAAGFLHPDFGSNPSYGFPYSVVPAGQHKVPVRFTAYGSESDPGPYPIPSTAKLEAGSDHHVLVASGDCHLYELFGAARSGSRWSAASGAIFNLRSNALRPAGWTSADAAGLPILPGLVRRDEVETGHIDHALRFTVAQTQRGYIGPATHQSGSTSSVNVPPMGARFRLKASFSLARFHGATRVILQCLKTYGMIIADNGSNWFISGTTDPHWNDTDLDQLKTVPGSAFEVVDTGPVHH